MKKQNLRRSQKIQTLKGRVIPQGYDKYEEASQEVYSPPPMTRLRWFLCGDVGCGKTAFVSTIPRACIFNFENKASAIPWRAPGTITPYLQTCGEYLTLFNQLIEDGHKGKAPFDVVVFDVMARWVQMFREYLTRGIEEGTNWNPSTGMDITSFGKDGAGWDLVNRGIIEHFNSLYDAGYGVIVLSHLRNTTVGEGANSHQVTEPALTPRIMEFLYQQCEWSGCFDKGEITTRIPTGKTRTISGKTQRVMKEVTHEEYILDLMPESSRIPSRQHVELEDYQIVLPPGKGWEVVDAAYTSAVEKKKAELLLEEAT